MKKEYKKPNIGLFPTKCHISTLSPDEPEDMNQSRRNLLKGVGLMATVGHISLYGGSDSIPANSSATVQSIDPRTGRPI